MNKATLKTIELATAKAHVANPDSWCVFASAVASESGKSEATVLAAWAVMASKMLSDGKTSLLRLDEIGGKPVATLFGGANKHYVSQLVA